MFERNTVFANPEELRQYSVYLRSEESNRDFDFLVLIDPQDREKRPAFIRELYRELIENENEHSRIFARDDHRRELENWIGPGGNCITPLSWLKIAIERYPNRLFLVIDPDQPREAGGWKNRAGLTPLDEDFWHREEPAQSGWFKKAAANGDGMTSEDRIRRWFHPRFLYQRICWVDKREFSRVLGDYQRLFESAEYAFKDITCQSGKPLPRGSYCKLWLYLKWVIHLSKRVRRVNQRYLLVNFFNLHSASEDEKKNPPYFADTLPPKLRADEPGVQKGILMIDLENTSLHLPQKSPEEIAYPTILFRRHANTFRYYGQSGKWQPEYGGYQHVFYGEGLSGALSYWSTLVEAVADMHLARSVRFILSLTEQALLRTYLVDERVQDWYGGLNIEVAGSLIQQRVFVAFLGSPTQYNQRKKPGHNLYATVNATAQGIVSRFSDEDILKLITTARPIRNKLDLLVIHQGILDKWKPNGAGLPQAMLEWKDSVPFLVITSGRGMPSHLPPGVKFLPYSAVESCINGAYFEKLTLVRQVNSIIREEGK
ncbi:MAG: hypothetical protein HUU32_12680 [Calditrichaceae bacterium]|nr:hypothetical protein [Calditrichia bacterium]NUQ42245.1 hypothetical protein [Calditrichaceae bacterium]